MCFLKALPNICSVLSTIPLLYPNTSNIYFFFPPSVLIDYPQIEYLKPLSESTIVLSPLDVWLVFSVTTACFCVWHKFTLTLFLIFFSVLEVNSGWGVGKQWIPQTHLRGWGQGSCFCNVPEQAYFLISFKNALLHPFRTHGSRIEPHAWQKSFRHSENDHYLFIGRRLSG